ncbi:hypothetical protein KFK09_011695 [Dendrobium nobile]|uniref:Uncharacterized protein n=1 Tax=Dendrobium nobile TaxID=94219 RepID=A0A8T3BF83_DENNO|nr:hypothetical protein KFK09_011695 [Dendrobium nobile]
MALITLGTSGIKPCISSFDVDQFDPIKACKKFSFFAERISNPLNLSGRDKLGSSASGSAGSPESIFTLQPLRNEEHRGVRERGVGFQRREVMGINAMRYAHLRGSAKRNNSSTNRTAARFGCRGCKICCEI